MYSQVSVRSQFLLHFTNEAAELERGRVTFSKPHGT